MELLLWLILIFLVVQRLAELQIADRNKEWMMERGAKEWGKGHYFLFLILHTLFFLSLLGDFLLTPAPEPGPLFFTALLSFIVLQALRIWCIGTLGKRWNTRIIVLPDEEPINRGLYRYIKHPNYVIVFFELLVIPVLFQAYVTAFVFPFLHLLVLQVRIPAEERALRERV
ncbi:MULTISPECIES: isoprenylcysteine carboxylmethyltransferase family protein [unclassified Halobacillus]|uniref:isoprenylcysteine carboxyl methyltransferase family protein n=1 Tax=unclassified Halobacillus TaxID=2636472 RepID=UPI0002A4E02F|nr:MULTISPECIES: isoprenylcysteine carboxylmethyltransferase family protein [unclassified Halobacillus]ELK44177.1 hypothetical protein D479_20158 [Halobacillus sp. BAB-2008]